ncbi:Efflux pump membrane transporter BepE [Sporomusa silvacetica DSM 10669]|uniref:Efflux pump membrane transporter BepE n=1 Tax=Sporomusa silvacetica DSM 10669 TaxID=1123289 RepID=A0ABZ3IQT5_9FIRM|nr:efflux RND transporter permease subunit [Sporomusa silvacetica]OZC17199.1 cation efflux system protein CusA [Sporomusa silvacetica DSM 10669]
MKGFNLTKWALEHKHFLYFFIVLFFIAGIVSYNKLGRMEDPDFTIKQMVVTVAWPGATARQVEEQVTDKVEKKLQDLPGLDYLKSYSTPGVSVIYVNLKDTVPRKDVRSRWVEARNMVNDMASTLPTGVASPQFNDRFDEVYGVVYALTGDGYSYEEMREKAEKIRRMLLDVPSVKKIQLLGVQTEKIYIEIENRKLAQLGIDPSLITSTLQAQNTMAAAGMLETASDNVYLRITGMFENLDNISNTPIQANGRTFRLGDIAKVTRAYAEPSNAKFYYNGVPALGISLAMEPGGNILTLGENLEKTIEQIKKELPAGLEIHQTVNQPKVVETSIDDFVESLAEAILIVLVVSFVSLGMRSGIIVALCIPLVIAVVFTFMNLMGIDLQRISLGALIIALGLLVDDAIITIETMVVKLEEGWSRFDAACFAYTSTAYPRLTGELVTCAGFIPVGFAPGSASEYCATIFSVVVISLLTSWIVAGTATPLLGYLFIKIKSKTNDTEESNLHNSKFYLLFKDVLIWCLQHRKLVLTATVGCFIASIGLMGLVKQEFFPASTRPELIIQLKLQEGAAVKNSDEIARQVAQKLEGDPLIAYYTYHVGEGAPRFVLSFEPTFNKTNFSEFVIVAKDATARDQLQIKLSKLINDEFPDVQAHYKVIANGPSADYPLMLRVRGYDHDKVREIAKQVETVMAANPGVKNTNLNWDEKSKVLHLEIDQDKARKLGIASQSLATSLQAQLSGSTISEFREGDKTVSMVFRFDADDRNDPSRLKDFNIHIGNGKYVPLDQIAKISFDTEEGLIYRYNLKPMIIVQAEINPGITGDDVAEQIYNNLADLRASLPLGYSIEYDGSKESSIKASKFMAEPIPMMIIAIMVLLMTQLQNIPKMVLTLLTAPLGIIGVTIGLLLTGKPMGFVVQLGILALAGIIMRNTVILMDQIDQLLEAGESLWDAIINATVIRLRPILLTAAAAILGMIPLVPSVFWGPMAVAIAAGLLGATVLTLLVLPVMYAAWYKAQPGVPEQDYSKTTNSSSV